MRKDFKAPETYPKKHQLAQLKEIKVTEDLHKTSFISDFDIEKTDKFIISAGETNKILSLYDRNKDQIVNSMHLDFNPTIVRCIPSNDP